ncbi:MAG TPA: helix-turn-helix domain-containing protein, partial [Ktedonobacterales bacterium]
MENPRSPTFGALLKRHRRKAGLSQQELAERVGYSVGHISRLEREVRVPVPATVELLADALGLGEREWQAFAQAADVVPPPQPPTAPSAEPPPVDLWPTAPPPHVDDELPAHLTPLVGREHEHAAAAHLLTRPSVRLLTLTGAGGVGKTRLALQVAEGLRSDFADGICFVALAELTDPALVLPAIARALGLHEGNQSVRERLRVHLRHRSLLLVLDNFEHLFAAGPEVVQAVAVCRDVKLLATSRSPLHVGGEHEMSVSPLEVPDAWGDPSAKPSLADLSHYAAVTLFVQRAQAVRPTFELTTENVDAVVEICRHVDGLPLAIELAAARIRMLTPQMLLARLDSRLAVLTAGARDLPERQQTLRATLDWSYHLLKAPEQRLLRWLAVFTGGWTLEAAEAICAEAERLGIEPAGAPVLSALGSLIESSLVRQMEYPDGSVRYSLLETVREYALEQLEAAGVSGGRPEAEMLRQAQANYFLALPQEIAPEPLGRTVMEGLSRLQREHANLRSALAWALERREINLGLRLAD